MSSEQSERCILWSNLVHEEVGSERHPYNRDKRGEALAWRGTNDFEIPDACTSFHWWAHSVIRWNVLSNPVEHEQRQGRVHRYLGHVVRENVADTHGAELLEAGVTDPCEALFSVPAADVGTHSED